MEKFIECEGNYDSKVFFYPHVASESIRLTKIAFEKDSEIPEGFEIHSDNYVEQETLCAVLIEEDQIDEEGYEFDLWEEVVDVSRKTYFKLAMDFNDNKFVREAKEIINQQKFKFRLYYEMK